jgi:hypothetical protein
MRLSEIYVREIVLREFWNNVEEELSLTEADNGLNEYLDKANSVIFDKFKINPSVRNYFIAGSARLYLYPALREAFELTSTIGDLDIVIPNKQLWINAGLEKEWNENGIYRPTSDGTIEAFNVWDPRKAGSAYADVKVRTSNEILRDSTLINGYYYMSLNDIADYKTNLSREKEQDVVALITQYSKSGSSDRTGFLRQIVKLIGLDKAKQFLGIVGK